MKQCSFLIRTTVVLFLVAIAATRSPAPVIEAPESTPSVAPPAPPPPPQATEGKPSTTPKTKRKKAEPEAKPKKETLAVSEPTKPVQPTKPAVASSRAFAGTWKGMMPDGRGWSIVISPDENTVTAFGPGEFQRPGAAHVDGNTISWSSLAAHQKNSWQLKLQPGGRRAEVTAFHVSGNMSATFDKTN